MPSAPDLIEALLSAARTLREQQPEPMKYILTAKRYDLCVAEFGAEEVAKWAIRSEPLPPNEREPART